MALNQLQSTRESEIMWHLDLHDTVVKVYWAGLRNNTNYFIRPKAFDADVLYLASWDSGHQTASCEERRSWRSANFLQQTTECKLVFYI